MSSKSLTQKGIVGIVAAIMIGSAITATTYVWAGKEAFVAKVNGEVITANQFQNMMERAKKHYAGQIGMDFNSETGQMMLASLKKNVLDSMVDMMILKQQAGTLSISLSDSDIDSQYKEFIKSNYKGDDKAFERDLLKNRMTKAEFQQQLKDRLLVNKVYESIIKDIKVNDADIETYYKSHKETFTQAESIEAQHILIKIAAVGDMTGKPAKVIEDAKKKNDEAALKQAQEILAKLKGGAKFDELAKKHSEDDSNKDNGGSLGAFKRGDMVKPFEDAAWTLKPGEITSAPVKSEFGYHLIKRGNTIPPKIKTLAEVKDTITGQLKQQKQKETFENWMKKTKQTASIEIKEEVLAPPSKAPDKLPPSGAAAPSGAASTTPATPSSAAPTAAASPSTGH